MNFDAFSHGQIESKIWLCDLIEGWIPKGSSITILGGWYNILGFMMNVRKPNYYSKIESYDISAEATTVADKICDTWKPEFAHLDEYEYPGTITNTWKDANQIKDYGDIIINCSVEHMTDDDWFHNIPKGRTVCLQTSDIVTKAVPWLITNPIPNIQVFAEKYEMNDMVYLFTKRIQYADFGYNRFMLVGRT